jgi:hypothetical protein
MKGNGHKNQAPEIFSCTDLTHLNPGQRMNMLGNEQIERRRRFLKKIVGFGIVTAAPMLLIEACAGKGGSPTGPTCSCQSDNPCSCESYSSCSCQSNSSSTLIPRIASVNPSAGGVFDPTISNKIRFTFNKLMDYNSLISASHISPGLSDQMIGTEESTSPYCYSLEIKANTTAFSTSYTIEIKGTAKDTSGKYFDGNNDGTGGDSYLYKFSTKATDFPRITSVSPSAGSILDPTVSNKIQFTFNKLMDKDSLISASYISPGLQTQMIGTLSSYLYTLEIKANAMAYSTSYTIEIKGTAKDTSGKFFDGDNDGTGGDSFLYKFSTKASSSCSCQSNCSSNTCSCQSNCSTYCPYECCDKGCPLYRI